jgi:nucleoid-associated protein YgaU
MIGLQNNHRDHPARARFKAPGQLESGGSMSVQSLRDQGLSLSVLCCILALFGSGCASAPELEPAAPTPAAQPRPAPQPVAQPAPPPREEPVEVQPTAPQQYVVVEGDTLWDISTRFLKDPWFWPEIWHVNPQVANPHLIFPGDVLTLYYVDGRPYISITGGPRVPSGLETTRLSPQIRVEPLDAAREQVPVQTIRNFLIQPRVVPREVLESAPYIVDSQDQRLAYGRDDRVYVRNLDPATASPRYSVFRQGKALRDPESREILGYEAIHIGEASLVALDDISTVVLTNTVREAFRGDRLLPIEEDRHTYYPRAPQPGTNGTIISLFDALSQVAQNQVAVINLGNQQGLEKGHVLAIYQAGRTVRDPFARRLGSETITLPEERTGVMLVFKTFDQVSYGLIMESTRPIEVGDAVRNP